MKNNINKIKYANFRNAKLIEVIKVEVNEGSGTSDDPIARVVYLCSKGGRVLAKLGESQERKFAGTDEIENIK